MPQCPNDASEMVSTDVRRDASRTPVPTTTHRCCPTCGYAE